MNYETATLQVIFVIQKIAHLIDHLADHFNITHQTKPPIILATIILTIILQKLSN